MLLVREELRRSRTAGDHAISIGVFDGVHRGHRLLVERMLSEAASRGLTGGIVTFHPAPVTVLRPEIPFSYLESLELRVELLRGLGVDFVSVLQFTSEVAQVSAEDFARLLVEEARMRLLVVGEDFALGRGREGTTERLAEIGASMGFDVLAVPLLHHTDDGVSSTRVRKALADGDMEQVDGLLGHPFTLRGPVLHGHERGREIGFPTINLGVSADRALPPDGVYVSRALLPDGALHQAATSIGVQPTFDGGERLVETHLIDFDADLYDEIVSVEILHFMREQVKFDSVDELIEHIGRDVEQVRAYFAGTAGGA